MTDPRTGRGDPEQRLRKWFAAEVQRAGADLAARPTVGLVSVGVARRTARARTALARLVATVAAVLVAGVVIGPRLGVIGTSPTASASPSAPPSTIPSVTPVSTYAGGIPTAIAGRPVLVGTAISNHIATAADDTPFLIGGQVERAELDCASPNSSPDIPLIGDGCGSGDSLFEPAVDGRSTPAFETSLVEASGVTLASSGLVVLRVHVHDAQATGCPPAWKQRCEQAVVVERVVWGGGAAPTEPAAYADGIPRQIDGQPVLRAAAFIAQASATADDTPFLVGGWSPVDREQIRCPAVVDPLVPSDQILLLPPCGGFLFSDAPGASYRSMASSPWVWQRVAAPILPPLGSSFVMKVHTHDPRAANCLPVMRGSCENAVVEDAVLWVGPASTDAALAAGLGFDGVPSTFQGQSVPRFSSARLGSTKLGTPGCCTFAGWAEGPDSEHLGHLQVADAGDASQTWSIDLGLGFEADVRGPVIVELSAIDPLRGALVWRGGS